MCSSENFHRFIVITEATIQWSVSHIVGRINQYTVGGGISCDPQEKSVYCNGKLKLNNDYCIKLRAYTNNHHVDSPCAFLVEDKSTPTPKSLTHMSSCGGWW